jgi:hypothetical protein
MIARLLVCALLLGAAGVAGAQNQPRATQQPPATRPLTPEQRAALQKQNEVLVKYADRIIAMIDNGQVGQVWDQASDVAKKTISRDQFVRTTDADRARLGAVKSRKVAAVTRTISRGNGKLPAGEYVNVNYATQFDNQAKPTRELVSFHLVGDRKWRLSGYTVRPPEAATAAGTPPEK